LPDDGVSDSDSQAPLYRFQGKPFLSPKGSVTYYTVANHRFSVYQISIAKSLLSYVTKVTVFTFTNQLIAKHFKISNIPNLKSFPEIGEVADLT